LSAAQAAGHGVKVAVSGMHAPRLALFQDGAFHLDHDAVDHLAGGGGRVALAAHVHAQDALAGLGQDLLDIDGWVFGGDGHAAGGVQDATAGHVVAEDGDMVIEVAPAAMAIHLGQDTGAADPLKLAALIKALGHGEQVGHAAAGADGGDCRQDALVGGEEKVFGVQLVPLVNDVGVQHERTKDVALGRGVVGNGSGLFHSTGGWPSSSMISAIKNMAVKKIRT
jgi:hypothetical protein